MRAPLALLLLASACGEDGAPAPAERAAGEEAAPAPEPEPEPQAEPPRYRFVDATEASGLGAFRQVNGGAEKLFLVETVGGGVALVDVDQDGDLDAYLTNGSVLGASEEEAPRDALYLNDGTGRFTDGTAAAGLGDARWTNGVRVVDYDADGWPDLYLTNYGPNALYRNDGDGTFTDVTEAAGVGDPSWSTGACFLDHDGDGDLDLYVANYVAFDEARMLAERPTVEYKGVAVMKGPRGLPEAEDTFYVNRGDGTFREASEEVGIRGKPRFGFQCVAFDADEDGWVDVYVANDSVENVLWRNVAAEGGGRRFEDVAFLSGLALSMSGKPQAGMGVGLGDFDADGRVDVYVTNFSDDYFTLYRGTERDTWIDATHRLRLADATKSFLGWACGLDDLDADGDLEIWVANGHVYPQVDAFELGTSYRQRNLVFEYADGSFRRPPGGAGPGFELERVSRGAALGDVDGDGDPDLLFGNLDGAPTLLLHEGPLGSWLRVRLVGAGGNRDAVGASAVLEAGGRRQLRLAGTSAGFLSSSDPTLFFGLGTAAKADALEVRWPSGAVERFEDLPAGARVTVEEGAGPDGTSRLVVEAP